MIRIILIELDAGPMTGGGQMVATHRTMDVELPALEDWLREPDRKRHEFAFVSRAFVGVELLATNPEWMEKQARALCEYCRDGLLPIPKDGVHHIESDNDYDVQCPARAALIKG